MAKKLNNYYKDINEKLSVLYKKEDGDIKRINKAIEFFDMKMINLIIVKMQLY